MLEFKLGGGEATCDEPWAALLPLAPHLVWAIVVLIVLWIIGPARIVAALSRVSKVGIAGLEIEIGAALSELAREKKIDLPSGIRTQVAKRLEDNRGAFRAARILWIDDEPRNNRIEIGILHQLGTLIDLARTNEEAQARLDAGVYNLVLSDRARPGDEDAGFAFAPQVAAAILQPPLIFYVGRPVAAPRGAFGLTTRPDQLFNLIVDALSRRSA